MQRVTNNTHLASGNCMNHKLVFFEVHQKPETEIHPKKKKTMMKSQPCIPPYLTLAACNLIYFIVLL